MSKTVLGVYNSKVALVQAIEEFQNEGYSLSNFSVLANLEQVPSSIENKTGAAAVEPGVEVEAANANDDHRGILKSLFLPFEITNDNSDHQVTTYYDQLVAEGINEADARKYEEDIRSGMMILLADNSPGYGSGFSGEAAGPTNGEGVNGDITDGSMVNGRTGIEEDQDIGTAGEGSIPELHEDPLDPPQSTGPGQEKNGEAAINETRERFVDPRYS